MRAPIVNPRQLASRIRRPQSGECWNDRSIEQRRLLFGAKTLQFADIVAGGMNPLTQAIWVAAADGTVIRLSPYADGAESLARMIFKPEPDEPTP